jgi:hypothetical protein
LQIFISLRCGSPGLSPPPIESFEAMVSQQYQQLLNQMSVCSAEVMGRKPDNDKKLDG